MAQSAIETTGSTYSDTEQLFRDVLPADPDVSWIFAGPSAELIRAATFVCWHPEDSPPMRLLADEDVLTECRRDFSLAARMADLEADDRLLLFAMDGDDKGASVAIQDGGMGVLLPTQDGHAVVPAAPGPAHDAVQAYHEQRLRAADGFDLRTPGLSRVRQTLEADLGADMRQTFDELLELVEWEDAGPINERQMCLLAAAQNGVQLYQVSKWAEDISLASKATMSREKTGLETTEILDTEKVPMDVGRPRLRLHIHESVAHLPLPQLIDAAAPE